MVRFRLVGRPRKGKGGKGKGGKSKNLTIFKVKKPAGKSTPRKNLIRAIAANENKLFRLERQLKTIRDPLKRVNLSIELCGQKIVLANSRKDLFNWWLKHPKILAILEVPLTQKKLREQIVETNEIIAEEEQNADIWRKRKNLFFK